MLSFGKREIKFHDFVSNMNVVLYWVFLIPKILVSTPLKPTTFSVHCCDQQHFRELANYHWCVGHLVLVCFGAGEGQLLWHLPGLCGWLTRNVTTCSIPLLVQVICSKSKPQQPKE